MVFIDKCWKIVIIIFPHFPVLLARDSVFSIMKSKDLQNAVALKHQNGDNPTNVFRDLNGVIGLTTVKRWYKMIDETGSINLSVSSGRPRTARTNGNIKKVKQKLQRKKVSTRKATLELDISHKGAHKILRNDFGCRSYTHVIEPTLAQKHKEERKKFSNWIPTNFRTRETLRILFCDEKRFGIDGVYNTQNDRIWTLNRDKTNQKGSIHQRKSFPHKVMIWLRSSSKSASTLVIFDQVTVDHDRYIKEVLLVT